MDREMKKRKKDNAEEEENEEEKMEMFFALIRSTRDVRERRGMSNEERLKLEQEQQKKKVWNPTFQPEDFMEDHPELAAAPPPPDPDPITSTTQEAGPSNSRKEDDEANNQEDKRGVDLHDLDLKLSL